MRMLADAAVFLVLGEVIPINCMAQNGRCGQGRYLTGTDFHRGELEGNR